MGEFRSQVEEITNRLSEKSGDNTKIDISEVVNITTHVSGSNVNCYPGIPGDKCYKIAYFYSLTDKSKYHIKRGKSLSLSAVLDKLVSHMRGACEDETQVAILITDNWDANVYNKWKGVLERIKKNAHLEIYLVVSDQYTEIKI